MIYINQIFVLYCNKIFYVICIVNARITYKKGSNISNMLKKLFFNKIWAPHGTSFCITFLSFTTPWVHYDNFLKYISFTSPRYLHVFFFFFLSKSMTSHTQYWSQPLQKALSSSFTHISSTGV